MFFFWWFSRLSSTCVTKQQLDGELAILASFFFFRHSRHWDGMWAQAISARWLRMAGSVPSHTRSERGHTPLTCPAGHVVWHGAFTPPPKRKRLPTLDTASINGAETGVGPTYASGSPLVASVPVRRRCSYADDGPRPCTVHCRPHAPSSSPPPPG
jgi:hypothetical protein